MMACAMTPTDMTIETGDMAGWGAVFTVPSGLKSHLDGAVASVAAHPRDVFTAKLVATQNFVRSLQSGTVAVLGAPRNAIGMSQVLGLLCVIATFTRLTRVPDIESATLRWVRLRDPEAQTRRMPIMPLDMLHAMADGDARQIDTLLSILEDDGAILSIGEAPGRGVVLLPGFVNDDAIKGLLV